MILNVRIELDKSKENYQAVLAALEAFDIASASWEDRLDHGVEVALSGRTEPSDLTAAVSAAINQHEKKLGR